MGCIEHSRLQSKRCCSFPALYVSLVNFTVKLIRCISAICFLFVFLKRWKNKGNVIKLFAFHGEWKGMKSWRVQGPQDRKYCFLSLKECEVSPKEIHPVVISRILAKLVFENHPRTIEQKQLRSNSNLVSDCVNTVWCHEKVTGRGALLCNNACRCCGCIPNYIISLLPKN